MATPKAPVRNTGTEVNKVTSDLAESPMEELARIRKTPVKQGKPVLHLGRVLLSGPPHEGPLDAFALRWVPTGDVERSEGELLEHAALQFTAFDDLPPMRELVAASVRKGIDAGERETLAMSLQEELPSVRHQLLGCVHPSQDSPVVEALCALRGLRPPLPKKDWAALEHEAEDWVAVLQLSDTDAFSFAGNGALFVLCTKEDLAARRFENCRFVIQR